MAIQKKYLIGRWNQDQKWKDLYHKVIGCLLTNGDLGQLTLPQHEGRWDLRGIGLKITGSQVLGGIELPGGVIFNFVYGSRPRFVNIQLRNIDFSHADLDQAIFENCLLENVLFIESNGSGVNDAGSTFQNVDLTKAKWGGATLGLKGARYEKVSFRRADLRNALCYRAYFIDCDFSDAVLQNVDFLASHFIRCKFRGTLKRVWFRGYYPDRFTEEEFGKTERNVMENVDFSEAVFAEDVVFANDIDLSRVIPPQTGKHILFRNWPDTINLTEQEVKAHWEGLFRQEAIRNINYVFGVQERKMNIENLDFVEALLIRHFPEPDRAREFAQSFIDLLLRSAAQAEQKSD